MSNQWKPFKSSKMAITLLLSVIGLGCRATRPTLPTPITEPGHANLEGEGIAGNEESPISPETTSLQFSSDVQLQVTGNIGGESLGPGTTFSIDIPPEMGSLTTFDESTGDFVYQPNGSTGEDTFTYSILVDSKVSASGNVTIALTNINEAFATTSGKPVHVAYLGASQPNLISPTQYEDLTINVIENPQFGDLTFTTKKSENGTIITTAQFVPGPNFTADSAVISLSAGGAVSETRKIDFQGWLAPDFKIRKKITLNAVEVTEDLVNFPALVQIDANKVNYDDIAENGTRIRFTDELGNLIPHEIEKFDMAGTSSIWVSIPNIPMQSSTTSIFMYYNHKGPEAPASAVNPVWGSEFSGVWHFTGNGRDSSLARNDVTLNGGATIQADLTLTTGDVLNFDGAAGSYASRANTTLVANAAAISYSYWVKPQNDTEKMVFFGANINSGGANSRIGSEMDNGILTCIGRTVDAEGATTNGRGDGDDLLRPVPNVWNHISVTKDFPGDRIKLFLNGVKVVDQSVDYRNNTTEASASAILSIGADEGVFDSLVTGQMDELRIAKALKSEAWIKADYLSQIGALTTIVPENETLNP